jgi:hypothetical protein
MAETDRTSGDGQVRVPNPAGAEQDPENLERQRQIQRDREALEAQAERVEATAPPELRERTIGQIVAETARRAEEGARR